MKSDRSLIGTVVAAPSPQGGVLWYRIRLSDARIKVVPESDLVPFEAQLSPEELFLTNAFGDLDDLRRVVTFSKLDEPLENTLYSLNGSRTQFYPHQYKPLIKFLDSQDQRLLIADEVGLGKTIEAGLILAEQRARGALRNVLVVCPASLRQKWQEEMWRRFDEEFEILQAGDLNKRFRDLQDRGDVGGTRDIVSLETLRTRQHLEILEATPLPLDLLIVDEAHHLRNRETLSHRVCSSLAEAASAVLLLTATPIHLDTENLFNLFRVLDPNEFDDFLTFEKRLRANEPVVDAQRLARNSPVPIEGIRNRMSDLEKREGSIFFTKNPIYNRIVDSLREIDISDPYEVTGLQQDLEELSLLSHVFSRSKKREVFYQAPERSPRIIRVEFTPSEKEFYDAVTEFVRDMSASQHGTIRFFATMGAQRQVASSLQAARWKFTRKAVAYAEKGIDEKHDFDFGEEHLDEAVLSERVITAAESLGDEDTKYDRLLDILNQLDDEEPNRKILIFAYYKDTLNYLSERLANDGFNCELIHGDIRSDPSNPEQDERAKRMRNFRENNKVRILLSSEVGSEGLDFQFCHILVNYDLPWNPMRVEQRIGRLDRLGQQSDRIIIVNFSVADTIEDRVLHRLYQRIGIFEASIGDLEAILGGEIEHLQQELLSRRLTPEEEERRIERTARAIQRRKRELERLESESSRLVGLDGYFQDQLRRLQEGGGLLSPADLEAFFRQYIGRAHPRASLAEGSEPSVFVLNMDNSLEEAVHGLPDSASKLHFIRRAIRGKVEITFDASVAFANEMTEFLGSHHPVLRLAVGYYRNHGDELHSVSAVRLNDHTRVAAGVFLYAIFGVDIDAGRKQRRIDPLFLRIRGDELEPVSEGVGQLLLGDMLRNAVAWESPPHFEEQHLQDMLTVSEDVFLERLTERRRILQERNTALVQTRLASLEESYRLRYERKQSLLRTAKGERRDERYIRLLEGTLRNMERDYQERRGLLEGQGKVRLSSELVACGLLDVRARQ